MKSSDAPTPKQLLLPLTSKPPSGRISRAENLRRQMANPGPLLSMWLKAQTPSKEEVEGNSPDSRPTQAQNPLRGAAERWELCRNLPPESDGSELSPLTLMLDGDEGRTLMLDGDGIGG